MEKKEVKVAEVLTPGDPEWGRQQSHILIKGNLWAKTFW